MLLNQSQVILVGADDLWEPFLTVLVLLFTFVVRTWDLSAGELSLSQTHMYFILICSSLLC